MSNVNMQVANTNASFGTTIRMQLEAAFGKSVIDEAKTRRISHLRAMFVLDMQVVTLEKVKQVCEEGKLFIWQDAELKDKAFEEDGDQEAWYIQFNHTGVEEGEEFEIEHMVRIEVKNGECDACNP